METAGERAAIGAETARMEGRGAAGQGMEAAKAAATGRVGRPRHRRVRLPGQSRSRSVSSSLSSSDEESMRRRHGAEGVRTVVSNEGEAFCPNPNARNLVSIEISFHPSRNLRLLLLLKFSCSVTCRKHCDADVMHVNLLR